MEDLFAEELGFVLEVLAQDVEHVLGQFAEVNVPCYRVGSSLPASNQLVIIIDKLTVLSASMRGLRDTWEETSFKLEALQVNLTFFHYP